MQKKGWQALKYTGSRFHVYNAGLKPPHQCFELGLKVYFQPVQSAEYKHTGLAPSNTSSLTGELSNFAASKKFSKAPHTECIIVIKWEVIET